MERLTYFFSNLETKLQLNFTRPLSTRQCLATALALSTIVTLLNRSWMFNRLGELDHFAYLGAAVYFPHNLLAFPGHPVTELAPTYLITALLYHLLLPEVANLIKDELALTLALYIFLNVSYFLTKSAFVSLSVAAILSGYYYFLASIGSDYTDCFIQLFCLAHLYIIKIFFENKSPQSKQNFIVFTLGIISALTFSSGVLSCVYIVNFLFLFLLLHFIDHRELKSIQLIKYFGLWLLGASITAGLLSLYLYALTDGFYMKYNLNKLFNFVSGAGQFHPLSDWLPYASWLILPSAVFLYFSLAILWDCYRQFTHRQSGFSYKLLTPTSVLNVFLFHNSSLDHPADKSTPELVSRQRAFIIFLITTTLSLIFIQIVVKQWSLQFMYFSQINLIYFLGLAIILSTKIKDSVNLSNIIFIALVVLISAYGLNRLSYQTIDFEMIITNYFTSAPTILPWLALVFLFLALITLFVSEKINRYALMLPMLIFNIFSYSETHGGFCCVDSWKVDYLTTPGTVSEKFFEANFKLAYFLNDLDPDRHADVWFDERERLGLIMRQVFSMNYFNSPPNMINKLMPQLGDYSGPLGSSGHPPTASRPILIVSEDLKKIDTGLKNLESELAQPLNYEFFAIKIGKVTIHAAKTTPPRQD